MNQDSAAVAKDAYGYSLGYYTGDYTPIGGTTYHAFTLQYSQTTSDITGQSLYNGNISNTTYAINQFGAPVGYTYAYDQLNRLKRMRQYAGIHGANWSRSNITMNYQENVTYDGNGNILTYGRNGVSPTTAQTIDSLTYHYALSGGKITDNKLNYITDAISSSGYNLDLRNQADTTNYRYDALGNLVYDAYSGITGNGGVNSITWSVYNKPLKIYKAGVDSITYLYNTANQRISKNELGTTSWYIRDAQGNVLALYDNIHGTTNWREQDLYGSSRLGMWTPDIASLGSSVLAWDTVGKKQYELDNHLGNVMTTVTDKRLQHSTNGTTIDYFVADVVSAQDYYPFGMLMPGRQYTFGSDSTYRYGFNGKENDNAVKGLGNQQDYGERIYDPRVVRFLSVDPLFQSYPELSSYQFAGNDPINFVDLDGLEPAEPKHKLDPFSQFMHDIDRAITKKVEQTETKLSTIKPEDFDNAINNALKHPGKIITGAIKNISKQEDQVPKDARTLVNLIASGQDKKASKFAANRVVEYGPWFLAPEAEEANIFKDEGNIFKDEESLFNKVEVSGIKSTVDLNIVNVELKGSLKEYSNVSGVYLHVFDSGTVYVGQATDLAVRPKTSLTELLDKTGKYKATAAKAEDMYSGRTILIKLEGSGAKNLDELENQVLQEAGGTMKQGGNTYNIRRYLDTK